ncbi:hypothetical protein SKAU_G00278500 [Synaphobranchus kaupii]|uniref:Uncharacterized protein n=1 Tax=Synaphobranchus kaupii TaxID=118154 RepID=A0A9Q1IMS3_SYNKA|nr:hypothetical protein SKAU_G00278500 [Synaphobranchus kaupii]
MKNNLQGIIAAPPRRGKELSSLVRAFTWEDLEACPLDYLGELLDLVAEAYPNPVLDLDGCAMEDLGPCLGHDWCTLDNSEEEESWDEQDGSPWCEWCGNPRHSGGPASGQAKGPEGSALPEATALLPSRKEPTKPSVITVTPPDEPLRLPGIIGNPPEEFQMPAATNPPEVPWLPPCPEVLPEAVALSRGATGGHSCATMSRGPAGSYSSATLSREPAGSHSSAALSRGPARSHSSAIFSRGDAGSGCATTLLR